MQTTVGCDSIVTLNLTINNAVVGDTTNTTVCDSLVWNGSSYSSTGLYNDTLQTISGCDSIITLNLTVSSSETATISYGSLGNSTVTGLQAGDIAITAFSMDNPDEISFVCLKEIALNTVIYFTDNGWRSNNTFRANEGIHTWTAPTNYAIGDVVNFELTGPLLSSSGDQILAYTGSITNPTFLFALNSDGAGVWQTDATNASSSALPQGLTDGVNALALNEVDNGFYNGITTGSVSDILSAVSTASNWSTNNSRTGYDAGDNGPNSFSFLFVLQSASYCQNAANPSPTISGTTGGYLALQLDWKLILHLV